MNIVITGSSSGIGRALADSLVAKGHSVWGLARSAQSAITGSGRFIALRCDVSDWTQIEAATNEIAGIVDHLDGLVACAGIQGEIAPALTADPLNWSATVRANLDGTYFAIRGFASLLTQSRRAKIVCMSGGGATKARVNFSAYGAAKTAIVRLVENIAEETRHIPFDINAIAPGAINTRLTDEVIRLGPATVGQAEYDAALKQKATGGSSLARALGLIEFLLSEKSDSITGRLLAAPWDPWTTLDTHAGALAKSDIYTLRRIVPEDRPGLLQPGP